ncbi:hypothetical protein B0H63DRAFT_515541 [Podospora didyma]|uniref:Uncharacterized protein n=1 Tax=Podospora didyma TaxID=330526 RepID=A0AAE0K0G2_9PEZI|nr:hypothetical protein B0H63DRAFT_515541 [Podospora didyma]
MATEEDFDINFQDFDIDDGPTRLSLAAIVKAGHPFSLPWSREVRALMTGLDSDAKRLKAPEGPWMTQSPFDLRNAQQLIAIVPDSTGSGGMASAGHYRDSLSTSSEVTSDHLSASLGITIRYPFLNASVSAKYDKSVPEDKKWHQSITELVMSGGPSHPGRNSRAVQVGEDDSPVRQGRRGALPGAVLFVSASLTIREESSSLAESSTISFNAYSTLDAHGTPCEMTLSSGTAVPSHQQEELRKKASNCLAKVASLQKDVSDLMAKTGIVDGARLPFSNYSRLCRSGLVVELLLAPFARLNEYVECAGLRYAGDI